jgi:hypothetical protein
MFSYVRFMRYRLREDRDRERVGRVAAAARAENASAMDVALAQIGAAFDDAAVVNGFKIRVERWLRLAPDHPASRARFGARAALLSGRSLNEAIAGVEQWWREERKAFQVASALGCSNGLSLDVLRELHLILRIMRFKRMGAEFSAIVAALCEPTLAAAAE